MPSGLGVAAVFGNGSQSQGVAVLRFTDASSIGDPKKRSAVIESLARADLFAGGNVGEPIALGPLIAAGLLEVDLYILDAGGAQLSAMQTSAQLDAALGSEPRYVPYATVTQQAGEIVVNSIPPVAYANGLRQISTSVRARDGAGVAIGVVQAGLAVLPLKFVGTNAEASSLRTASQMPRGGNGLVLRDGAGATPEEMAASVGGPTGGSRVGSEQVRQQAIEDANGVFTCWRCGHQSMNPDNMHLGHRNVPASRGGNLSPQNVCLEGAACNFSAGNRGVVKPGSSCAERGSCGAPYGRSD